MKILARTVPIATIVGAATAVLSAQLGFLKFSAAEQIVIGLMALIAIDSLVERLGILARIEESIKLVCGAPSLRRRSEIIHPVTQAASASTIDVLAVSGISLFAQNQGFYLRKLREGARMRVILLDPNSPALPTHAYQAGQSTIVIQRHIESTLSAIRPLLNHEGAQIEVRLGPCFAPFSMVGTDLNKESGRIVVEFHVYRAELDQRPHVLFEAHNEAFWYGFFRDQFETAWAVSTPLIVDVEIS